jgi:hypothetical protein
MIRVVFIADFFSNEINGGGENNDSVLINFLRDKGIDVETIHSQKITPQYIENSQEDEVFIVSNFVGLSEECKRVLEQSKKYIIYEHDHKYVRTRDPAKYVNYEIPQNDIVNYDLYKNAKKVVVLSTICKEILERELKLTNVHSISTSLWSKEKFEFIRELNTDDSKLNKTAVVESHNPTKGTPSAVEFCRHKNIEFDLISSPDQKEFLSTLNQYENLVFIPQVLETFCRLVAEAKMLNCNVYTKKTLLGFMSEPFSDQCDEELISTLEGQVSAALDYFYDLVIS